MALNSGSLHYQPKQCTIQGKSLRFSIDLNCFIPPTHMDGCHQQNCILCSKVLSGCIPIAGHLIHQDMYALLESFCGALMWNLFLCTLTKPDLFFRSVQPMQRICAFKKSLPSSLEMTLNQKSGGVVNGEHQNSIFQRYPLSN